jgi:hypothetical protein
MAFKRKAAAAADAARECSDSSQPSAAAIRLSHSAM